MSIAIHILPLVGSALTITVTFIAVTLMTNWRVATLLLIGSVGITLAIFGAFGLLPGGAR